MRATLAFNGLNIEIDLPDFNELGSWFQISVLRKCTEFVLWKNGLGLYRVIHLLALSSYNFIPSFLYKVAWHQGSN